MLTPFSGTRLIFVGWLYEPSVNVTLFPLLSFMEVRYHAPFTPDGAVLDEKVFTVSLESVIVQEDEE